MEKFKKVLERWLSVNIDKKVVIKKCYVNIKIVFVNEKEVEK
jgi:hypothetical protein